MERYTWIFYEWCLTWVINERKKQKRQERLEGSKGCSTIDWFKRDVFFCFTILSFLSSFFELKMIRCRFESDDTKDKIPRTNFWRKILLIYSAHHVNTIVYRKIFSSISINFIDIVNRRNMKRRVWLSTLITSR